MQAERENNKTRMLKLSSSTRRLDGMEEMTDGEKAIRQLSAMKG